MTFHHTISQQAVDIIRGDIIHGALKPGEKLNEQELAERYRISRTPLREAIRQLSAEGLVEFTANKGARVCTLSSANIKDLFEARIVIEIHVIGVVCNHIAPEDLKHLRYLVGKLTENHLVSNFIDNYGLFLDFNSCLLRNCPNVYLRQNLKGLHKKFASLRFLIVKTREALHLYQDLDALVHALEAHNPAAAQVAARNILETYQRAVFGEIIAAYPNYFRD